MKFTFQLSSIVHDGSVVIANLQVIAACTTFITLVKVVLPVFRDVVPVDVDVIVSVCPRVLVVKA